MKGLLALARREIVERGLVFAAAAAASVLPFAVPLVRGLSGSARVEARQTIAAVLAGSFAIGIALVLGASVVARDLKEKRLGFYFARPLSSFSIWAGKLGAAWALSLTAAAIVLLPSILFGGIGDALGGLPAWAPWGLAGAAGALVLLAGSTAIAMRSRSPFQALDAAGVIALVLVGTGVTRSLLRWDAGEAFRWIAAGFAAILLAALALGSFAALARGRVDVRRAHAALSTTFWAIAGAGALAAALFAGWVLAARPKDLARLEWVGPAPSGDWVALTGRARGAEAAFLFEISTGRSLRVPNGGSGSSAPFSAVFSEDGRLAVWFEPAGSPAPYDLSTLRLDDPAARPRRTRLSFASVPSCAILSKDGRRIATAEGAVVTVYDLASERALASARIPGTLHTVRGFFRPGHSDRLRLYASRFSLSSPRLDIYELDTRTKTWTKTGAVGDLPDWFSFVVDRSGDRLLIKAGSGGGLRLHDARTGAPLALLLPPGASAGAWPRFLADGRIVFASSNERAAPRSALEARLARVSGARLHVCDSDGAPLRTIEFPSATRILLGAEAAPGRLVIGSRKGVSDPLVHALSLADLDSGDVRRIGEELYPAGAGASYYASQANLVAAPGGLATRLYFSKNSLVALDPLSGTIRPILGRKG